MPAALPLARYQQPEFVDLAFGAGSCMHHITIYA
jgi:hypothetical protein